MYYIPGVESGIFDIDPAKCQGSPESSTINLSILLIIGTVLSYTPQYAKIVRLNSSLGISPFFMLLGAYGAISNIFNIVLLSYWVFECCSIVSSSECLSLSISVILVSAQTICFLLIFIFFVVYYPKDKRYKEIPVNERQIETPHSGHSGESSTNIPPIIADDASSQISDIHLTTYVLTTEYKEILYVVFAVLFYLVICTIVSVFLLAAVGPYSVQLKLWARFLGLFSFFLTCTQYIPQITRTIRTQFVGAISIPMMLIQSPGGYLFAYAIYSQVGSSWTSWLSTFSAATFQGVLLVLCIYYNYKTAIIHALVGDSRSSQDETVDTSTETEAQPLLPNPR